MNILAKGTSMLPTLKEGKIYSVKLIKEDELKVGDIVVYCVDDLVICHRVVKIIHTQSGNIYLKTKGDNCVEADPYAITLDMVVGKVYL